MKNISKSLQKSLIYVTILSLFTSILVSFPSEVKAYSALPLYDQKTANAPVEFSIKTSHSDLGDTDDPEIIATLPKKFINKNENDWGGNLYLFNISTGELYDESYFDEYESQPTFSVSKFADQGVHYFQVLQIDSVYGDSISDTSNVISKSNIIAFQRKNPITINLWAEPWEDDVRFHDAQYSLNQHINGDDYRVELFNTTMDTRASFDLNWAGWRKEDRLDYIEFHQPEASHSFVAVLKKVGVGCNYLCDDAEKEIYQNQKYSELNDVIATSNSISVNRNPWSVELKDIEEAYEDDEIEVVINRGAGSYAVYLVEDSTGEILEISTNSQGHVYMLEQPNPHKPNLDWITAYVAWDYEEPDGKEVADNVRPTHVSQLKHIIADSKGKKDIASLSSNTSVNLGGKTLVKNAI